MVEGYRGRAGKALLVAAAGRGECLLGAMDDALRTR